MRYSTNRARRSHLRWASGVFRLVAIFLSLVAAGGCNLSQWAHNGFKLGPNYCRPVAPLAEDWIQSDDPRVLDQPPLYDDWWGVFNDPALNNLVQIAYQQNLTLRQAGMRVMQARANRAITAGNLFPQQQQAFGNFDRIQESQTIAVPSPVRAFDEWEVGFNASWEIDVWGRFRRAIESADANLGASIAEYDFVLITLISEVVTAYIDIRTFEERLRYARQNVDIQKSSLKLSQTQFDEGKTNQVGVYLARANLSGTASTVPSLEVGLQQAKNRLCTLLGIPPSDVTELLGTKDGIPSVPAEIALGIPADLLRRRPDIRQAERLVAAQSAQIGVALADLYPSIAINGEVYQASEQFSDLFRSASAAGSIGPSFRWNILNYGRIRNNVRLQDSRLLELIASYQNKVLEANQEVEDALIAFLKSQEEVKFLQENVDDLDNSLELLIVEFEEGAIEFSPVFVLQGSLREAQDRLAAAQGRLLVNLIDVYRALGGGWQIRCPGFLPQLINDDQEQELEVLPLPDPVVQPSESMDASPTE